MKEKPEQRKTERSTLDKLSGVIRGAEVIVGLLIEKLEPSHIDSYLKTQASCLLASIETAERLVEEIEAEEAIAEIPVEPRKVKVA